MKKLVILIFIYISFFLLGCNSIQKQYQDYKNCIDSPECLEIVESVGENTSGIFPGITAPLAGMVATLITGVLLGKKRRSK